MQQPSKSLIWLLLAVVVNGCLSGSETALSLSLSVSDLVIDKGEVLSLRLNLSNMGDYSTLVQPLSRGLNFFVLLENETGVEVVYEERVNKLRRLTNTDLIRLDPGDTSTHTTKFFVIGSIDAGVYKINATYEPTTEHGITKAHWRHQLYSNEFFLTITGHE